MSFLFFFASLVSAAVAAEAVRRRRNVREATKVGAVLFAVLSLCGSVLTGTDAAVGCAAAVCVLSVNTDRKSTRLNSSHIPLSRMPSSA